MKLRYYRIDFDYYKNKYISLKKIVYAQLEEKYYMYEKNSQFLSLLDLNLKSEIPFRKSFRRAKCNEVIPDMNSCGAAIYWCRCKIKSEFKRTFSLCKNIFHYLKFVQ